MRLDLATAIATGLTMTLGASAAMAAPGEVIARTDLSRAFTTRSLWQLIATQGAEVEDPGGNTAPGAIALCLTRNGGKTCLDAPGKALRPPGGEDSFSEPHFIEESRVVEPRPGRPMLLLRTASFHAGNGDQRVATQLYAYDKAADSFALAFEKRTGRNNNQEIR